MNPADDRARAPFCVLRMCKLTRPLRIAADVVKRKFVNILHFFEKPASSSNAFFREHPVRGAMYAHASFARTSMSRASNGGAVVANYIFGIKTIFFETGSHANFRIIRIL